MCGAGALARVAGTSHGKAMKPLRAVETGLRFDRSNPKSSSKAAGEGARATWFS